MASRSVRSRNIETQASIDTQCTDYYHQSSGGVAEFINASDCVLLDVPGNEPSGRNNAGAAGARTEDHADDQTENKFALSFDLSGTDAYNTHTKQ